MNNNNTRRLTKPRRNPGQWTSYNKVLVGCGKRPHARNPNFDWDETKLLISLWGDPGVQRTLITTHKKYPVIAKIAMSMREHGYNRTPEEINTRIKNLKCFYNRVKKDLEMGVIQSPSWPHYVAMDEILSRPIFGNNARMPNQQSSSQSSQSPKDSVAHLVEPEIKEENMSDDDSPKLEIIDGKEFMIKDEPLEDDDDQAELLDSEIDEDFDEDIEDDQPPLPKLQKISDNYSTKLALPQLDKIISRPVELKLLDNPISSGTTVISNSPSTNGNAAGKISLVPTNILLKPQVQNQLQYSAPAATAPNIQTISTPSKIPTTSQGMKLVFVNAITNTTAGSQPTTNSSQPQPAVLNTVPKLQPKVMPALQPAIQIDTTPKINVPPPQESPLKDQGYRGLLKQLVRLQNENLTMQRQRLNVERQRLEVEKNLGNRIIDLLSTVRQSIETSMHTVPVQQPTRSSYRLRREKRTNHHSSDYDDQD